MLHCAAANGHDSFGVRILEKYGGDMYYSFESDAGVDSVFLRACSMKCNKLIQYMLDDGFDVRTVDGARVLEVLSWVKDQEDESEVSAMEENKKKMVSLLTAAGVEFPPDNEVRSLAELACKTVRKALVQHGHNAFVEVPTLREELEDSHGSPGMPEACFEALLKGNKLSW